MGIEGYAWQYWRQYGGSTGDARRYWGAVWGIKGSLGGTRVSPSPLKQLRGSIGASPGHVTKLEGQCLRACT